MLQSTNIRMNDIYGNALLDYQQNNYTEDIITFSSLDEEDVLPLPYLFRSFNEMPILEQKALKLCKGNILDIGAGAGSHSLWLEQQNKKVTALDASKGAIETCRLRGIKNTINETLYQHHKKYDTLLLLMNGTGLAGTLANIGNFFTHLKNMLSTGGQILIDSSDIIYMFESDDDGGYWIPDDGSYYGEVTFMMKYKEEKTSEFPWLYIDYNTLQRAALANGLQCELIFEGEHYDYLARLS